VEHRPGAESEGGRFSAARNEVVARLRLRSETTLRERWRRIRASVVGAAQAGLAAGLAWFVASRLLHHPQPIFAPVSAVIVLDIASGRRLRRAAELVLGVALGIAVGDVLIAGIGTGSWQVGLVVFLAVELGVFITGTPAVVAQAATSAVLIATIVPPKSGIYYLRFVDALVGGLAALGVIALLLPANPLTSAARKAGPACTVLADGLAQTAQALVDRRADQADAALTSMEAGQAKLSQFRDVLPESRETARVAPLRWGARDTLSRFVGAAAHLERALGNARVLTRRAVTMIKDGEPVPEQLPRSVFTLADATRELRTVLTTGRGSKQKVAERSVRAVAEAGEAYQAGLGFSGTAVVAQIRAMATDLLGTAGLPYREANDLVRQAGGTPGRPGT
jgi:uncharacterized membrane protein YgaE (UPF0421/DUF939 family)